MIRYKKWLKIFLPTVLILFSIALILAPCIQYKLYIAELKKEIPLYEQKIIDFQELIKDEENSQITENERKIFKVVEKINDIEVCHVSFYCYGIDDIYYEVVPISKFNISTSNSLSKEEQEYENLFAEYTLKLNHLEKMDYKSYLKYVKKFKEN